VTFNVTREAKTTLLRRWALMTPIALAKQVLKRAQEGEVTSTWAIIALIENSETPEALRKLSQEHLRVFFRRMFVHGDATAASRVEPHSWRPRGYSGYQMRVYCEQRRRAEGWRESPGADLLFEKALEEGEPEALVLAAGRALKEGDFDRAAELVRQPKSQYAGSEIMRPLSKLVEFAHQDKLVLDAVMAFVFNWDNEPGIRALTERNEEFLGLMFADITLPERLPRLLHLAAMGSAKAAWRATGMIPPMDPRQRPLQRQAINARLPDVALQMWEQGCREPHWEKIVLREAYKGVPQAMRALALSMADRKRLRVARRLLRAEYNKGADHFELHRIAKA
jgi:hypothetical protein